MISHLDLINKIRILNINFLVFNKYFLEHFYNHGAGNVDLVPAPNALSI